MERYQQASSDVQRTLPQLDAASGDAELCLAAGRS
jgi:hypothetical protein